MRHTDQEIEQAAERFEQLADKLDPRTAKVDRLDDLRAVAAASKQAQRSASRLHDAVRTARAHGRSWNQIGTSLGVTRQAARQRFSNKVDS